MERGVFFFFFFFFDGKGGLNEIGERLEGEAVTYLRFY
jgi:hypothetical protein